MRKDVIWKKKKKRDIRGQFSFCPIAQSRYIPLIKGFFFFFGQLVSYTDKMDILIRGVIESLILDMNHRIKCQRTIHVAKILQGHIIPLPEKQTITLCDST